MKQIFIVVLCCSSLLVTAQKLAIKNYSIRNGFPSPIVYRMIQDSKGYMWFGTDAGLVRYDGTDFKVYTEEEGLSGNSIVDIKEDSKGKIWILPFHNEPCYFENERITKCKIPGQNPEIYSEFRHLMEDKSGNIWIASTDDNIGLICISDTKVENYKTDKYGARFVKPVKPAEYGGMWVQTDSGRVVLCKEGHVTLRGSGNNKLLYRSGREQGIVYYNKRSYFFNENGLFTVQDTNNLPVLPIERFPENTYIVSISASRNLWVCTNNGAFLYNPEKRNKKPICYLPGEIVNCVVDDRDGNTWISTIGNGVYRIPKAKVYNFTGLADDKLNTVTGDRWGNIWLGGLSGDLMVLRNNKLVYQTLFHSVRNQKGNTVYSITQSGNNEMDIWGADMMSVSTEHFQSRFINIPVGTIKAATTPINGLNYIGTSSGLYSYHNNKLSRLASNYKLSRVQALCNGNGMLWVGTYKKLYLYYPANDSLADYGNIYPALNTSIYDIVCHPTDSSIWITTESKGVILLKDSKIDFFDKSRGLPDNSCKKIHIDSKGQVWITTDRGIGKITSTPDGYKITNYSTADGILSNYVRDIYTSGGKVWVATLEGLSMFYEDSLSTQNMPPLYINYLQVANTDTIYGGNILRHKQNDISIYYDAVSYAFDGRLWYRYQLYPLEKSFQYTTQQQVRYPSLPPGKYTFYVWVKSTHGVWSRRAASTTFTIEQPFWQRLWFIAILIVLAGVLLFLIYKWRIKIVKQQERNRSELENEMNVLKLTALRSQMNPHFIFNALNSIYSYIMENQTDNAVHYLAAFSSLIRKILNYSQMEYISVAEDIEALEIYLSLEEMRLKDKLSYQIEIAPDLDIHNIDVPPLLIQPYVENSVIHGIANLDNRAGVIKISFSADSETLTCTIEDNGVGREKAREIKDRSRIKGRESMGMSITQKRLEMINSKQKEKLNVKFTDLYTDEIPSGTRVELFIPLNN